MESTLLHPAPSSRTVATEQFRAVGLALKTEAFFFIGALLLIAILAITTATREMLGHNGFAFHTGFTYGAQGAIPMCALAFLIPFGVWRAEDPSRRAYHWSMPVARGPHTIMKFLSGWAWLMIAVAVYLLFIIVLGSILTKISGEVNQVASAPGWEWVLAFTATTIAYLISSIAVIGSDHAWRWIGGVVIGYWVLQAVFRAVGLPDMSVALGSLWDGAYGLKAALFAAPVTYAHVGRRVMRELSMNGWLAAMPLWIVGSAIAVTLVSYRHRE